MCQLSLTPTSRPPPNELLLSWIYTGDFDGRFQFWNQDNYLTWFKIASLSDIAELEIACVNTTSVQLLLDTCDVMNWGDGAKVYLCLNVAL